MKKKDWRRLARVRWNALVKARGRIKVLQESADRLAARVAELERREALTPEARAAEDLERAEAAETARRMREQLDLMRARVYQGVTMPLRARDFVPVDTTRPERPET